MQTINALKKKNIFSNTVSTISYLTFVNFSFIKKLKKKEKEYIGITMVFEDLLVLQELDRLEFMAMAHESDIEWTPPLTKLVDRVITHYENHYRVESNLIRENVQVLLLSSPYEWPSYLEDAFLWVGGWRPSMAFHLLDSNPGLRPGVGLGGVAQWGVHGKLW